MQALEAVLRAPRADIMVCVSHEGGTALTMEAERMFGGDVWLVTGNPDSEFAELVDEVIVCTPGDRAVVVPHGELYVRGRRDRCTAR